MESMELGWDKSGKIFKIFCPGINTRQGRSEKIQKNSCRDSIRHIASEKLIKENHFGIDTKVYSERNLNQFRGQIGKILEISIINFDRDFNCQAVVLVSKADVMKIRSKYEKGKK
jgi:hypothetical protein